jgi:urea carboxylase
VAKHSIRAPVAGSLWTHSAGVGQKVFQGNIICILECMKVEIPVETPVDGILEWLAPCGQTLEADDLVAIVNDAIKP